MSMSAVQQQRALAVTLRDVIFRLSQMEEGLAHVLRENLTFGEMEALVQNLAEAGRRASQLRPTPRARAKGASGR